MTELKAFVGLLNYYGKFLRNLATTLAPLYQLLQKNTAWMWGQAQEEAFSKAKELGPLQQYQETSAVLRCFPLQNWSRAGTPHAGWLRKVHWIHLPNVGPSREALCAS